MIEGQPHITALILGNQPTMNQAGADAEGTGRAMAKGQPFNCVRGQGRLTLAQCLERFLGGHPVCARDCGCSLGKRAVEKNPTAEETMGYKDKYGDCSCGKTGVKLDKNGRCYKCQEAIREAAKEERKTRVIGPAPDAPPKPVAAIQETQELDDGQQVGPRVEEAGERLNATAEGLRPLVNTFSALTVPESVPPEGQLVGDEDPLPDACQGWPETAGPLVIDGMEFEAFTSTRAKVSPTPLLSVQSGRVFSFNTGAIETFGLARFAYVELFASADRKSVAFKFSEDSPASGHGVRATDSKDRTRKRIGAQGFMSAFGLDLKGKGPWPLKQPQPGVLVARVG